MNELIFLCIHFNSIFFFISKNLLTFMKTKPGVIRPAPVKSKILLKKEEEVYEPNPFSKYLEDNSDFFSEQVSVHVKMSLIFG